MCALLSGADGRLSLVPGRYFRLLLIGYPEGIDGERGIAWRIRCAAQSFRVGLNKMTSDHSTISLTRRLIDVETHAVFRWVLELVAEKGLLNG